MMDGFKSDEDQLRTDAPKRNFVDIGGIAIS